MTPAERKEYMRKYWLENCEKYKKYQAEYMLTNAGKKCHRISQWKVRGMKCKNNDWNALYERYITTEECDNCGIILVEGNKEPNHKTADHSHDEGWFRNILCHSCNTLRGE